jgi:hypothetical protein
MATINPAHSQRNGQISWQLIEKLDEQRRYPRVELKTEVGFRNASGQHCTARLLNIAPDGIQIRCNVAAAQMLHPCGGKICPDNSPILQTEIRVPIAGAEAMLSVCARLTYLATLPEEPRCVMGLRFLQPRPTAQRILNEFFAAQLREYFAADEVPQTRATAY